jgi:mannose-1-phosphate guanylyltransferase
MYYAVSMAGGMGTRLWPLSRQNHPKQDLALASDKAMFQVAVERIRPVFPLERILVVIRREHADILQTDVGSWGSLFVFLPANASENVLVGDHLDIDTQRTLVFGKKRLVATLGVKDLIIVDTEDALLVCSREHEQEVKRNVEKLREPGHRRLL